MSKMRIAKLVLVSWSLYLAVGTLSGCRKPSLPQAPLAQASPSVEIKWDNYGVPHIFADDDEALFYAFGWSQMHSHANLILSLYAKARGRSAEYWGSRFVPGDALIRALEIPKTAAEAYAAQDAEFKRCIDMFIKGMNAYAEADPAAVAAENRAVLPVEPTDLFAHLQRLMEVGFIGRRVLGRPEVSGPMGSNALAVSPFRTASGNAMLVTNPHLPWSGIYTFYEAHFKSKQRDLYGVALVGLPVLVMAFNNTLGWAHTSNYVDGADLYEVEMVDEDHYRFDGKAMPLRRRSLLLTVKDEKGEPESQELTFSYTVHGPVVGRRGNKAFSYRSTRGLYPRLFKQYWEMGASSTLAEFRQALEMMQLPLFNIIYADGAGHIMYMWNGLLPDRALGDSAYWLKPVPGDSPETLWTKTIRYDRLPQIIDPKTGWVQNSNDLPWTSTWPTVLKRKDFPVFIDSDDMVGMRSQQLLKALDAAPPLSFDDLRQIRFSTRMELADRVVDDLIRAIGDSPHTGSERGLLDQSKRVLEAWDRSTNAESQGAVLFLAWLQRMGEGEMFAVPYRPDLLNTPRGLKDPQGAVNKLLQSAGDVVKQLGALDIKWGDLFRLKRGNVNLPANGGPGFLGIFHTVEFSRAADGKSYSRGGDSYSAIVEFSKPVRAEVLLSYGNSSQEDSPHNGDQLSLLAQKKMRRALMSVSDVDQNLARREVLSVDSRKN